MSASAEKPLWVGKPSRVLIALLACLSMLCVCSGFGPVVVIATLETEWAPGYRELEFRRIQKGETQEQVRARLDEPLRRFNRDGRETWAYTRSPNDTHYWLRNVHFDTSGQVESIHHELYFD